MKRNRKHGFTLIELSITLLVLSLMLGGILTVVTQTLRIEKRNQLNVKIEKIRNAMMDFRLAKGRLPCPGNSTLVTSSTNFGREGVNPADCNAGTPAASFTDAGENIFGGSVPVRTLGLTDEDAYDPWGNLFLYVVDKRVTDTTANSPFSVYGPTHASVGNITVKDLEGDNITTRALYILLSHGQNGHGAYMRSGIRKSSSSSNANEQANCHCDSGATATAFNSTFYKSMETTSSSSVLNAFDDSLTFVLRNDLLSSAELDVETAK